jgi:hypothetical protein
MLSPFGDATATLNCIANGSYFVVAYQGSAFRTLD